MQDLVNELQKLVEQANAALVTAQSNVPVTVVDPAWKAVQDALVAAGWTPPEVETPAEDANEASEVPTV